MQTSALKLLAQKAKKRLSTAGQSHIDNSDKTTHAYLSPSSYAIVANKQSIEDDPLFEKVKKIMESDDINNPLAELTDYSIFNNLSQTEKEMYIIDISKRYNIIRNYFNEKSN